MSLSKTAEDVIVCPPGEKHWHGAPVTTGMSDIAIQEALDGKVVDWIAFCGE